MRIFYSLFIALIVSISSFALANQQEWSVKLTAAILQEDEEQIRQLVSETDDLNAVSSDDRSPFIDAVIQSTPSTIELLIELGFDPNLKDENGYTPVMHALQFGNIENAKKLESLGASLEGITSDGYTVRVLAENVGLENFGPLYEPENNFKLTKEEANQLILYAAEIGDVEAVKFALKNQADIDVKAKNGWTPMMLAALGGHVDVFDIFVSDFFALDDFYYDADGVDLVTAILVGNADGSDERSRSVEIMLSKIKTSFYFNKHNAPRSKIANYRTVSEKLKYPRFILDFFPESYKPEPKLETDIPIGIPSTKENWKLVQKVLKDAGVYNGAIDGQPGKGTASALYAYYIPLTKVLKERSISVARQYKKGEHDNTSLQTEKVELACYDKMFVSKKIHEVCGEFSSLNDIEGVFSGYWFSQPNKNSNVYAYTTDGENFRNANVYLYVFEKYNIKNSHHTTVVAKVLDSEFIITISSDLTVYRLDSDNAEYLRRGNFKKPKRPLGLHVSIKN